ncbi:MAG TPA: dTDP-4-dehydrorhamnose 3,5-epimerase [Gaiellaceae bacterium]
MIFTETRLAGAFTIDVEPHEDERGFFARVWDGQELAAHGLETRVVQSSIAYNHAAGTFRGLHYQEPPFAETKLVRCTAGAIWDVVVDLRHASPTFLEWVAVELTAENHRTLYVPEEFAHGYQTLTDRTEVWYQMSAPYAPDAARGLRWDDPRLGIDWPTAERIVISERDLAWPDVNHALAL